jgi:hypothetical protein
LAQRLRHRSGSIGVVEHDARVLEAGESDQTPALAILTVILFLLPLVLLMMGLALGVYYGIG